MKKLLFLLFVLFMLISCNNPNTDEPNNGGNENNNNNKQEVYVPTDTLVSFSDENESKVITESEYDISQYTKDAGTDIKPYQMFQSGMCLQRDAINRIWGKASKSSFIAAEINGQVYYGTIKSREWEIYLPKMNAGGPYELTIISESGRFTLTDVYIGEVFFLGGQSNMEWQAQHSGDVLKDLYSSVECVNPEIRMLHIPYYPQVEATNEVVQNNVKWKAANQQTIKEFTAVGYLFGKKMQEELDCPVGLIAAPVGGSSLEFWLSETNYNKVQESYKSYITAEEYMQPCLGYNGMLYPLTGLNIRGVVWYQGESNAFGTQKYFDIALKIFLEQCREMFNNDQLAFTVSELARYEGATYAYSIVNEKINEVASTDSYVVVARNLDLGDWFDIHPKDKKEIAKRAAEETLRVFFKKDKPEPITVKEYIFNEDGSVTITLSKDATLVNGSNGFEVYVNNKYTYNCDVTINGNTLTVTANGEITKVRYGYTCEMTDEIKNDVSKMVTVYDENNIPLDLFLISK